MYARVRAAAVSRAGVDRNRPPVIDRYEVVLDQHPLPGLAEALLNREEDKRRERRCAHRHEQHQPEDPPDEWIVREDARPPPAAAALTGGPALVSRPLRQRGGPYLSRVVLCDRPVCARTLTAARAAHVCARVHLQSGNGREVTAGPVSCAWYPVPPAVLCVRCTTAAACPGSRPPPATARRSKWNAGRGSPPSSAGRPDSAECATDPGAGT